MTRLALLLCLFAFPAMAQQMPCGPMEEISKQLREKHGEQIMMVGTTGPEDRPVTVQFWANRKERTWTIVIDHGDGTGCLPASGDNLRAAPVSHKDEKPEVKS